jgi:hypothetical protein
MEAQTSRRSVHYAAFARALRDGRLGSINAGCERRRRIRGLQTDSVISVEQMISFGSETPVPRSKLP